MRLWKAIKRKIFDLCEYILGRWDDARLKEMNIDLPEMKVKLERYVPQDGKYYLISSTVTFWAMREKDKPKELYGNVAVFVHGEAGEKEAPKQYLVGQTFKEFKDLTQEERSRLALYYDLSEAKGELL